MLCIQVRCLKWVLGMYAIGGPMAENDLRWLHCSLVMSY